MCIFQILIDPASKRAYGVEFMRDEVVYRIRAKKEIILSAGAINSPQILMLSGVGQKEHLNKLGKSFA
jgi:choline dehydrogenase-like flavoprotein